MPDLKIVGKSGPALGVEINITDSQVVSFGRGSQMDVRIENDNLLSGTHFRIEQTDRNFVLTDLGSMNGTYVNQERVSKICLQEEDIIIAGSSEFEVVSLITFLPDGEESTYSASSSRHPASETESANYHAQPDSIDFSQATLANNEPAGFIADTAAEIIGLFALQRSFPTAAALDPDINLEKYIRALEQQEKMREAIELLAFSMRRRHAVWWACLCTREAKSVLLEEDIRLLGAAEAWVRKPNEDLRYAAIELANHTDLSTSASWACVSAFHCGESLAPQGSPAVTIAEELVGRSVSGAVFIASTESPDRDAVDLQKNFIKLGLELVDGLHSWNDGPEI